MTPFTPRSEEGASQLTTTTIPPADHPPAREDPDTAARASPRPARAVLAGLLLIGLGLFFLVANFLAISGSILFLMLGLVFMIARFTTGNYGFAVPAGILLGFGAFVVLNEAALLPTEGAAEGPWFFLMLGAGFCAVYVIGARPRVVWPLFPAAVLAGFGLAIGQMAVWPLASLAWMASYWPAVLIAIGLWLLVREQLPAQVRGPVGTIGLILLLFYALVAIGAGVASNAGDTGPIGSPFAESVNLAAPIGSSQTLRVINTSGRTTIRPGTGAEVRVTATKHLWWQGQEYDVRLTPTSDGLTLEAPSRFLAGSAGVDYLIEAPSTVHVDVKSDGGDVDIEGFSGRIQVDTGSGDISLRDLSGAVTARTSSGSQRLTGIRGELRASSSSGSVRGSGIERLRDVTTSSGGVDLAISGADGRIETSSGDVTLRFAPGSSLRVDVTTNSGDIRTRDVTLQNLRQERRSLAGSLGAGAGSLSIRTSSGDVTLTAEG